LQKLLKDLVRDHPASRGEPRTRAVEDEKLTCYEPCDGFERRIKELFAKLRTQRIHIHSGVRAQAQEPRLFVLLHGSEPLGFSRSRSGKIRG
jgi:hypothetical protein